MKKYLVEVSLPAAGQHYDAYLPASRTIGEVTVLLARIADSLSGGSYQSTPDAMLLDAATGSLFSGDTFFFDGVGNWEHPTGSLGDLKGSLERLRGFEFDALYPGHGPAIKTGGRKCLDKAIQLTGGRV